MNKLAILAFTLLLFFGAMLWYLANGSLNEYIKSQISLQGEYYTGQTVKFTQANFSANTGTGSYSNLTLGNIADTNATHVLKIDNVTIELENNHPTSSLIIITKLTINSLKIWQENITGEISNLHYLKNTIIQKLATDYPEYYPEVSAKLYAKNHPELNVGLNTHQNTNNIAIKSESETKKAIIKKLAKKSKRKRNESGSKIYVKSFLINNFELNIQQKDGYRQIKKQSVIIPTITLKGGVETNRLGGEILKNLLIYTLNLSNSDNNR